MVSTCDRDTSSDASRGSLADVWVGRQPIYDRELNLYAHELLFRNGRTDSAVFDRGDEATSQLMVDAFLEIGIERISEGLPVFVNIPAGLLSDQLIEMLPPALCVLEIMENVTLDAGAVDRLGSLRQAGYLLALDDFLYSPEKAAAVDAVDIVKLDLRQIPAADLENQLSLIRKDRKVRILAEKIETLAEFRHCRSLGFDLFQGYFLSRPEIVPGRRASVDLTAVTSLLNSCEDPKAGAGTIAHLLGRSPSLSYKLLQAANSSLYSRRTEITSLQEAVAFLGTRFVARLATLLLMAGVSAKPEPSLMIALQRACMCEMLAKRTMPEAPEEVANSLYMLGLLSGLDILLDQPLEELIPPLPLPGEAKRAIIGHEGPHGRLIEAVIACQQNDWNAVVATGIDPDVVYEAYWESLPQVDEARRRIGVSGRKAPLT